MILSVLVRNAFNAETSVGINMDEIPYEVISLPEAFSITHLTRTMGKKLVFETEESEGYQ
jgi:hypothetical protein